MLKYVNPKEFRSLSQSKCPSQKRLLKVTAKLKLDANNEGDKKILDLIEKIKKVKKELKDCKPKSEETASG